jgi:hypothetical protein
MSWEEFIFLTTKQGPTTEVTHPRPPPSHRYTTAQDNPTYCRGLATIFWGFIPVSTMEATWPTISTTVQDNTCFTSRGGPRPTMLPGLLLLCARSVTGALFVFALLLWWHQSSIVKISLLPVFCDGIVRPIEKIGVLSVLVLFFSRGAPRFATTSHLRFRPLRTLDDSQPSSFSGSIPAATVLASHSDTFVHQVVNGVPWQIQADTSRRPTACAGIRRIQHQKPLPASSRSQTSHTENRVTPTPGAATSRCHTTGVAIKRHLQHKKRLKPQLSASAVHGLACDNRVTPAPGAVTSSCNTAGVTIE